MIRHHLHARNISEEKMQLSMRVSPKRNYTILLVLVLCRERSVL